MSWISLALRTVRQSAIGQPRPIRWIAYVDVVAIPFLVADVAISVTSTRFTLLSDGGTFILLGTFLWLNSVYFIWAYWTASTHEIEEAEEFFGGAAR